MYRYAVRKRADLLKVIIPFFERYSLQTTKNRDFKIFAKCVRMMDKKYHLSKDGLIKILRLSEEMNHQKSKAYLIRILRNQKPKPVFTKQVR